MTSAARPRILVAGAGHAALVALHQLAREPAAAHVTLVSRSAHASYSGMLPGWIEGVYPQEAMAIDLRTFAARVGVDLVIGEVVGADEGGLHLDDGRTLGYDILVVNTGAQSARSGALRAAQVVPGKPSEALIEGIRPHLRGARSFVVVGGGLAGVEVALALRARRPEAPLAIVERDRPLLKALPRAFARRVANHLTRGGIDVRLGSEVAAIEHGEVRLADGAILPARCTLALTGAQPPAWLDATPFARAADGFLAVNAAMRSLSHPHVLAVGDVATRTDDPRPKAGVFSVRAGPPLAAALRRLAVGHEPAPARLQRRGLVLLSTGHGNAIGARNGLVIEGRIVWRFKNRLDRRFVRQFLA